MTVRRTVSCFGGSLGLRAGKRALEVRPRVEWHKGSAVDYIRRQAGFEDALCICIGDDVTDETMFRAFPDHLTVRVGWHAGSAAQYYVEDPVGVRELLDQLSQPARLEPLGVPVTC
jgi:trehalose-phosphatase